MQWDSNEKNTVLTYECDMNELITVKFGINVVNCWCKALEPSVLRKTANIASTVPYFN